MALVDSGGFRIRRGRTLTDREYHEQAIARGEMVLAESEKERAASRAATSEVGRGPADETAASPSPAPEPNQRERS
jgi:hypothetical protein